MVELFVKLDANIYKAKPLFPYLFAVLLFLASIGILKPKTTVIVADGKQFALVGFTGQKIEGETFLLPIYKEVHK